MPSALSLAQQICSKWRKTACPGEIRSLAARQALTDGYTMSWLSRWPTTWIFLFGPLPMTAFALYPCQLLSFVALLRQRTCPLWEIAAQKSTCNEKIINAINTAGEQRQSGKTERESFPKENESGMKLKSGEHSLSTCLAIKVEDWILYKLVKWRFSITFVSFSMWAYLHYLGIWPVKCILL